MFDNLVVFKKKLNLGRQWSNVKFATRIFQKFLLLISKFPKQTDMGISLETSHAAHLNGVLIIDEWLSLIIPVKEPQ
jgi:hypothetical protein